MVRARAELQRCAALGLRLVPARSTDYPDALRRLHDPPPLLSVRGRWPPPERVLAIVGARAATPYGRRTTERLAQAAARTGWAISSGLARGIDRHALEAALAEEAWPIAVLGCGIDVAYPPEHVLLQEAIAERGTLISEFPLGRPPDRMTFPKRNRIIAALATHVLVVEAGVRSGALITVDHATDLGREILAVPGPIDSEASRGTNRLIADGATPVLDEFGLLEALGERDPIDTRQPPRSGDPIAGALAAGAKTADEIAAELAAPPGGVRSRLVSLELEGRVRRALDGRWSLRR